MTVQSARLTPEYRTGFKLHHDRPPMRLWHKAKKLGVWNPRDIDFTQDARDWKVLAEHESDGLLRLSAIFLAGEESVALDLLPLILTVAREGRLDEEMFLTSFLWEEAKHVEAFHRFFDEVAEEHTDFSRYYTPAYRTIFHEELPRTMARLIDDPSPIAQAEASVTYNMIVEGVLAETGYHAYHQALVNGGILPGMQQVVSYLKRDESRHIAFGVYLLSRLVAEHGDPVWEAIEARMNGLLMLALQTVQETFDAFGDKVPFGLDRDQFIAIAQSQYMSRYQRIERARNQTLAEVYGEATGEE